MIALKAFLGLLGVLLAVFLILFLGGLASAWWEIRAEKRAGLVPTRPADEARMKRRVRGGGFRTSVRLWWFGLTTGVPQCWCGLGTLVGFPAMSSVGYESVEGLGCTAVEAGMPQAWDLHERAGGYARTPCDVAS